MGSSSTMAARGAWPLPFPQFPSVQENLIASCYLMELNLCCSVRIHHCTYSNKVVYSDATYSRVATVYFVCVEYVISQPLPQPLTIGQWIIYFPISKVIFLTFTNIFGIIAGLVCCYVCLTFRYYRITLLIDIFLAMWYHFNHFKGRLHIL
jgi:hypothetical protein